MVRSVHVVCRAPGLASGTSSSSTGCCFQGLLALLSGPKAVPAADAEVPRVAPQQAVSSPVASDVCRPWLNFAMDEQLPTPSQHLTSGPFAEAVESVADNVRPWATGGFTFVKALQEAKRNFGRVDLMTRSGEADAAAQDVAVKQMPQHWIGASPEEFEERNPEAAEQPWVDLGILQWLNDLRYPFVCKFHGLFSDEANMYVVSSLANRGDLFTWTFDTPGSGREREAKVRPLAAQAMFAVRWLHELGIGHRDLSLENMVLHEEAGELSLKLIDFGMATVTRPCSGLVGKRSYQAPEMHYYQLYDPFEADAFALGVTLFTMVVKNYPWASTNSDSDEMFAFVETHGFEKYMQSRKLRKGSSRTLASAFSPELVALLGGLLELQPEQRTSLGESCFEGPQWRSKTSVWDSDWWAAPEPLQPAQKVSKSTVNTQAPAAAKEGQDCCSREARFRRRRPAPKAADV